MLRPIKKPREIEIPLAQKFLRSSFSLDQGNPIIVHPKLLEGVGIFAHGTAKEAEIILANHRDAELLQIVAFTNDQFLTAFIKACQ